MKLGHSSDFIFITLFLITTVLPILMDWWQGNSPNKLLRYTSWLLMCLSLAGLYLKPSIRTKPEVQNFILLTEDYRQQDLDSLTLTDDYLVTDDLGEVLSPEFVVNQLAILGSGLDPWELDLIECNQFKYFPAPLEEGIKSITASEAFSNKPFFITGEANITDTLTLSIHSPAGFENEIVLDPAHSKFDFKLFTKTKGNFIYSLFGVRNGDTLFQEKLPVTVNESEKASILMVGSYPTFELNYLKNYLQSQGYQILSKFSISRNVSQLGFGNSQKKGITRINESLMSEVNLIIIDGISYAGLSRSERQLIEQKTRSGECGIFLIIQGSKTLNSFGEIRVKSTPDQVEIFSQDDRATLATLSFQIASGDWRPIQVGATEIGGFLPFGIGSIGFGELTDTYQLQLSGKSGLYGTIWNELLHPVLGMESVLPAPMIPTFAFIDNKTVINFSSAKASPVAIEGIKWPIINSPIRTESWKVEFWPDKMGWNEINVVGDSSSHYLFVHGTTDWQTKRKYEKQLYHRMYQPSKPAEKRVLYDKYLSKWIFFILFLISAGVIWVEQKLR